MTHSIKIKSQTKYILSRLMGMTIKAIKMIIRVCYPLLMMTQMRLLSLRVLKDRHKKDPSVSLKMKICIPHFHLLKVKDIDRMTA